MGAGYGGGGGLVDFYPSSLGMGQALAQTFPSFAQALVANVHLPRAAAAQISRRLAAVKLNPSAVGGLLQSLGTPLKGSSMYGYYPNALGNYDYQTSYGGQNYGYNNNYSSQPSSQSSQSSLSGPGAGLSSGSQSSQAGNALSSLLKAVNSLAGNSGLGPANPSNSYVPPGVAYTGAPGASSGVVLLLLLGAVIVLAARKG